MNTYRDNRSGCEYYLEHDRIMLHMKLDLPEGLILKQGPEEPDRERPFCPEVISADRGESRKCPLVIVQHGFTGHMEEDHIIAMAKALNETGFATLRTELYGHGKSGGAFVDHTLFKWLSEMLAIIDYAKALDFVDDLFLCGHSQGGLAVILAGAMKRDVIRAILPISPAVTIPDDARKGSMLEYSFDPDHVPDVLIMKDGLRLGGNHIRVSQTICVEAAIDAFSKDVLIIHGDEDETVPVQAGVDAAKRYRHAQLKLVHGADHCFNGHTDEMAGALKEYMKRFRQPA